jgi:acetolactate decarboxylase
MFSKTPGKRLAALILSLALLMISLAGASCGKQAETSVTEPTPQDTLYQVSTFGALSAGVYDGVVSYADIKQHGDCGIGTFQGLDGELVALDGNYYQIRTDGVPVPVSDAQIAPFAMVTFFQSDLTGNPPAGLDYAGLQQFMSGVIPTPNLYYAVRVEGEFSYMKIRTVPAQQPPYRPLSEVLQQQTVWELNGVRGTMIGFFSPSYTGSIELLGYHLHFISEDRRAGGHVMDCRTGAVDLKLDNTSQLELYLPEVEGFYRADLTPR